MVIYRVPPTESDVTLDGGVVKKVEVTWEKYNKSDLTEVKLTETLGNVQNSEPTFGKPADGDSLPSVTHDASTKSVEFVVSYSGFDSATPVDSYTATLDYTAPDFSAEDIDLDIYQTQLYDISPEGVTHVTLSGNMDLPSGKNNNGEWHFAYAQMVRAHEISHEFKEWSN